MSSTIPNPFNTLRTFEGRKGSKSLLHSLPALEEAGLGKISRLPVSIRVVLESVLRNCDGSRVREEDVRVLAAYDAAKPNPVEIPFVVSRIILQDFTGVPLLVDLAAMRDAVSQLGRDPGVIEPLVPVDLVVDHSVQVDSAGTANAFRENLKLEFERNRERYEFLKWGQQAFKTFKVVPPAIGIVHQVNLEYLAKLVFSRETGEGELFYPDTLVGTDSHTTMINGLGIVGWGVGGIEAEAGMLGQPVYFETPQVVGVHLKGRLREGVTATDLTLRITEILRKEKVVGKFVEFFGEGAGALSVADRATVANMAPEYGATIGFFPVDEKSLEFLAMTGRPREHVDAVRRYYQAQGLFGMPKVGQIDYSKVVELDLGTIAPCVSGPKRPQDRIDVPDLKRAFLELLTKDVKSGGYGKSAEDLSKRKRVDHAAANAQVPVGGVTKIGPNPGDKIWSEKEMVTNRPATLTPPAHYAREGLSIGHGSVLIAAITSCTNTSNPSVMLAAGLLAKKAVEKGLAVNPVVKTSLAPGSRVVTDYLEATGLQPYLDKLGFQLVGYGCTTCIGNSGPLDAAVETAIKEGDIVAASVLSGNRNFEARVHASIRANFLMSPPLVVAYALAGRVDIDLTSEPLGTGTDGKPVYLKDIWPTNAELEGALKQGLKPEMFQQKYGNLQDATPEWSGVKVVGGQRYGWNADSTYIQLPPFFQNFPLTPGTIKPLSGMRALAVLGDSVTTDHISPAGSIGKESPAGKFLISKGVQPVDFNSYGSRRGNDRIMTRGTFGNVRIRNKMADGKEGGYTKLVPDGQVMPIYDACAEYAKRQTPLVVFGGIDYGMGSSRDWAAKGTNLLGVKAVVARSFERIHRSNLVGMGVLPLEFKEGESAETLGLDGSETFSLIGLDDNLKPRQEVTLEIRRKDGRVDLARLTVRVDTLIEIDYYRHGGILPYVLRQILKS